MSVAGVYSRRRLDLQTQIGRGVQKVPGIGGVADSYLRLRARLTTEGSGAKGAAVVAGTVPLGKSSACGLA